MSYLRLGRYLINCPYLGVWRCQAPTPWNEKPLNLDWTPEECRDCVQAISFEELPEARIKSPLGDIAREKEH